MVLWNRNDRNLRLKSEKWWNLGDETLVKRHQVYLFCTEYNLDAFNHWLSYFDEKYEIRFQEIRIGDNMREDVKDATTFNVKKLLREDTLNKILTDGSL